jgi:hypothetical protein
VTARQQLPGDSFRLGRHISVDEAGEAELRQLLAAHPELGEQAAMEGLLVPSEVRRARAWEGGGGAIRGAARGKGGQFRRGRERAQSLPCSAKRYERPGVTG